MAGKILIVDDEADTISYLRLSLAALPYEIVSAKNGTEALTAALTHKPDIIILDVMMPDLDGYEVTRRLRGNPQTANIPILMFTAKTQLEDKIAGFSAGVDIYLTKPIHTIELQANVRALLSMQPARAAPVAQEGYVIGVLGSKGGVGVSTLALNLAASIQKKLKKTVIASELKSGLGIWGLELNITQKNGLSEVLRMDPTAITESVINQKLVTTPFGVRLMLASNDPADTELVSNIPQRDIMLEQLSRMAQVVVLDIGTRALPSFDSLSAICDEMILVLEPQPISARLSKHMIENLKSLGYITQKPFTFLTVNRARSDMQLNLTQIEQEVGIAPVIGFPPVSEQTFFAAKRGIPLIEVQPEGLLAQQFNQLAEIVNKHITAKGT